MHLSAHPTPTLPRGGPSATTDPTPPAPTPGGRRGRRRHRRTRGAAVLYTRMLARDAARNRVVTGLLVVLMMLSVVLATASAATLVRLIGASSSVMARADAPHVAQLHVGPYDQAALDRWVAGRPEVAHHQTMLLLGIDGAELAFDGVLQTTSIQQNSLVVPNTERDLLLDLEDQPIREVAPGTIVLPVYYEGTDGLAVGDTVRITAPDGFVAELTIAGFARDSIMNPAISSSKRLAVAPEDLERIQEHTGQVEQLIAFWLDDPGTQSAAFQKAYLDAGMPQAGQMVDSATFKILTMIGDGLVAGVVILVSMLLLVVAALCLRFSFLTAAEQDYREIGVLKAIGVAPRDVRRIYLTKYTLLAAAATALGLLGGWALTPLLTRNVSRFMGASPSVWNTVVPVAAAVSVLVTLVLFIAVLLRRFRRISAVEALRSGPTSQPRRARRLRLHRSRLPVHVRLGTMDVAARWPTYLLLFFVFAVSAFIVIVPVNSATTATAPDFINYMGVGALDVRADFDHRDDTSTDQLARIVEAFGADERVTAVSPLVATRHDTVDRDGITASLYVENGDHTLLPLRYAEGRAPTDDSEIAMSLLALNQAGRAVGDTVPLQVGGETRELEIVGSYQDVTHGGRTAKSVLPTGADPVMWYVVGVELAPGTDATAFAEEYGGELAPAKVSAMDQWRDQTLGTIADQITVTAGVSAVVAIALAVLMTVLFTRMLIARDAGQLAIQRAIGADDAGLRQQYLTRILLVLVLGVLIGTIGANTLGERLFNLMFEAMFGFENLGQGTSRIDFAVSGVLAYLVLPLTLLVSVTAATFVSCRSIAGADIAALTTE
jgi:putative ABC transport system permease protein